MADVETLIADLKANLDVDYWGDLLDKFDQRVAQLHGEIDGQKYTEWGLVALKALEGDADAKAMLNDLPAAGSDEKKIMDEMALLYLVQPILRHYLFRATNKRGEMPPG